MDSGRRGHVLLALILLAGGAVLAATPPDRVRYQGVLRDASNNPQDGSFDMVFRFFDAEVGGGEILVDSHTAADGAAVTVTGGLFDVQLGGGAVSDGSGAGTYTSLDQVFRDFGTVHLEITVGAETLAPRIQILSAAYALNADALDGNDSSFFINTSAASQTKNGDLTVGNLTASGNNINFGVGGAGMVVTPTFMQVTGGDASTDALLLRAGALTEDDGAITVRGNGEIELRAGNGQFEFWDGSTGAETATLNPGGNLQIDGDATVSGNDISFGSAGVKITAATDTLTVTAGDLDTDDLILMAGNSSDDGQLSISGDGTFELRSGSGLFSFVNGTNGVETASLDASGNLQLDGDLTVSSNDINIGSGGANISATGAGFTLTASNEADDFLELRAGPSLDDGGLRVLGDESFELRSGNGLFNFVNGNTAVETASLDASGNLQLDGDVTVSGNDINFGSAGANISADVAAFVLTAGDVDTDNLALTAGNSADDGRIFIAGDAGMELRAGNGNFSFVDGASGFERAALDASGNLQLDGILDDDLAVTFGDATTITVQGTNATLNVGGANLDLTLGDSAADDVFIPGNLDVTGTKNFRQNHPHRKDLSILYTALEGDESGTYTRGSARLVNGEARVPLGETFAWVTNPDIGLTAHVTPRREWAGLYVETVTTRELVVRSRDDAVADAAFDYVVYGLRIGYEDFPVVQARQRESTVPAEGYWAGLYQQQPDLSAHSALHRFRRMRSEFAGAQGVEDWSASRALRQAIGEHQPGPDAPGEGTAVATAAGAEAGEAGGGAPAAVPAGEPGGTALDPAGGVGIHGAAVGAVPMDAEGNVYARSFRPSATDLANLVEVAEAVTPGHVLVIDPSRPGLMSLARAPGDAAVFGIVAAQPGVVLGASPPLAVDAGAEGAAVGAGPSTGDGQAAGTAQVPVALSGVVLCKVDASYGAVRPGDLLTTSPTPGHAMRAFEPQPGTILGKALEPLDSGTGLIRILVMLR
jgi:hypothetical protein